MMKFTFEGLVLEGKQIGYVSSRGQFKDFLKHNKSEIEEIITDLLEDREIFQWDELDIELRVSTRTDENQKHRVIIGDSFSQTEAFEGDRLVRTVSGVIYCLGEI